MALIEELRVGPSKLPLAVLALAALMALRTEVSVRPKEESDWVSTWIRTAGRWPPDRVTRPTPGTWLIFCARRVSTRFCTSGRGVVSEVTASVRTGASAGLTLA